MVRALGLFTLLVLTWVAAFPDQRLIAQQYLETGLRTFGQWADTVKDCVRDGGDDRPTDIRWTPRVIPVAGRGTTDSLIEQEVVTDRARFLNWARPVPRRAPIDARGPEATPSQGLPNDRVPASNLLEEATNHILGTLQLLEGRGHARD